MISHKELDRCFRQRILDAESNLDLARSIKDEELDGIDEVTIRRMLENRMEIVNKINRIESSSEDDQYLIRWKEIREIYLAEIDEWNLILLKKKRAG